ncbi:hypothetical protein Bca101_087660 [Brassica carinata]
MEGDGASGGEKRSTLRRKRRRTTQQRTVSVRQIKKSVLMSWTDGYTSSRRPDIKELKTALEEAKKRLHVTG